MLFDKNELTEAYVTKPLKKETPEPIIEALAVLADMAVVAAQKALTPRLWSAFSAHCSKLARMRI